MRENLDAGQGREEENKDQMKENSKRERVKVRKRENCKCNK